MQYSKAQIVSWLKSQNWAVTEFTVTYEGDYHPDDVDWNYKDMKHLNFVHDELATAIYTPVGDDYFGNLLLQNIFGFRVPICLVSCQPRPGSVLHMQTTLFFVLLVEEVYYEIAPGRTRVDSNYALAAPKLLGLFFPILRRIVIRNKHRLMDGDVPMRERRGLLRSWGFSFVKPGDTFKCTDSFDISRTNVIAPEGQGSSETVSLEKILPSDGEALIGRDDHLGVRLVRKGARLSAYPRLCPHEGASLDRSSCAGGKIACHWHGRVFTPIATFDLAKSGTQEARSAYMSLRLAEGQLQIIPLREAAAPRSRPADSASFLRASGR